LALALAVWALAATGDLNAHGAGSTLIRVIHLMAGMVWAGFIVYVNFIQLAALKAAGNAERPAIVRLFVAPSSRAFTAAAHASLLTGVLMLVPLGAGAFLRPLLAIGMAGGIAMWAIVQFVLVPNVARITGKVVASDAEKAKARAAIALWARVNLVLVVPVTLAMFVGAHTGL